jgi:hypothetical protein
MEQARYRIGQPVPTTASGRVVFVDEALSNGRHRVSTARPPHSQEPEPARDNYPTLGDLDLGIFNASELEPEAEPR